VIDEPTTTDGPAAFADAPQPVTTSASYDWEGSGGGVADEHPELLVGAAFVGGLVLAKLLKRLGSSDD
jgi:hypothetical protein